MEKYRKFADDSTGINPFVPIFVNKKYGLINHILHWVIN